MYEVNLKMGLKSADFLLSAVNDCIDKYEQQLNSETISDDEIAEIRNDLIIYKGLQTLIKNEIEKTNQ